MKPILTLSFICVMSILVTGQTITIRTERAADRAFEQFSYAKAADLYRETLKDTKDSLRLTLRIADCYRYLNLPDSVERYLRTVADHPHIDPIYHYYFAEALLSNNNYREAEYWYENYKNALSDDARTPLKLDALQHLSSFFTDSANYTIRRLDCNTPGLDFSPVMYGGGLLFVSSRSLDREWVKVDFTWDESRFLDLFYLDNTTGEITYFHESLKSKYHEGPADFYDGDTRIAFTRNNFSGKRIKRDDEGVTRLKIYFSTYNEQKQQWESITPYEHNSDSYSVGHPALNAEGSIMIFTSDMPGGAGETDLYISYKEEGKWMTPKNLGLSVNSEGREMFPTLVGQRLFFASDGMGGLGGLDIFSIDLSSDYEPTGEAINVGYPINSSRDDFGLVANDDFSHGYFTSARIDSNRDDVYEFSFTRSEGERRGFVLDARTGQPIVQADVFLLDTVSQTEIYTRSDSDGAFEVPIVPGVVWAVKSGKFGYLLSEEVLVGSDYKADVIIRLHQEPSVKMKFPIAIDALLRMYDSLANLPGADIGLNVHEDYMGMDFRVQPIYYDLDKYDLRPEAVTELDKLKGFLLDHPRVVVEMSSHTDSRAGDEYNLNLSQMRVNAAFDYLISQGVADKQLIPQGYGATRPVVDCTGRECSEAEHQMNRRTEFLIIGIE